MVNYKQYLASREWALRKRQVRERSWGRCERCAAPQEAAHHLTYERLGNERLEDLLAVCDACHEYLSGLRPDDPATEKRKNTQEIDWALALIRASIAEGHDPPSGTEFAARRTALTLYELFSGYLKVSDWTDPLIGVGEREPTFAEGPGGEW